MEHRPAPVTSIEARNDKSGVGLDELAAAPIAGSLVMRAEQAQAPEKTGLFFLLDCPDCPDGVKAIAVNPGTSVGQLANIALGHREIHWELDPTYAEQVLTGPPTEQAATQLGPQVA